MKKITAVFIFIFLSSCIGFGVNSKIENNGANTFPKLVGIDLEGNQRQLPQVFDAKKNIVIVAFKREQQKEVDSWMPEISVMTKKNPQIKFYEIPLIYEMNMFSRSFINNGMRRGVKDRDARLHTITVYTNRTQFFDIMKMKENSIYVLVIDNKGRIKGQVEGGYSKQNLKKLKSFL